MISLLEGKLGFSILWANLYDFMDLYQQIVHVYFFLSSFLEFFFFLFPKHTVASEFLSMQTAIKLSIKKKGSSFSFTDAQYLN